MADLYPVFDVPCIIKEDTMPVNKQKGSIYFDFEKGDFLLDQSGKAVSATPYEAWCQWCLKTVYTQRFAYLGYSDQVGAEIHEALNAPSKQAAQSMLIKTISDACMADPYGRTLRVYDFMFNWLPDGVEVKFTLRSVWGEDAVLTAKFKKGGVLSGE